MKKIYFIIICIFILAGCGNNKNITTFDNLIMNLESDYVVSNNNIETILESEKYVFKYDEKNVGKNKVVLYLYYSSTCPHCHAERKWLNSIKDKYDYLTIIEKEASSNMDEYENIVEKMSINDYHVPLTIIGSTYYIGFADYKINDIIKTINFYSTFENCDMVDNIINNKIDMEKCKQINKK